MANRLQIVNTRNHGDDESYVDMAIYPHDVEGDLVMDKKREAYREAHDREEMPEGYDAEEVEDFDSLIYVNDDFMIADGQIIESGGRKYRIDITEVP